MFAVSRCRTNANASIRVSIRGSWYNQFAIRNGVRNTNSRIVCQILIEYVSFMVNQFYDLAALGDSAIMKKPDCYE